MPKLRAATAPKARPIAVVPDDREHERERGIPAERQTLRLSSRAAAGDHVPDRVGGDAHQRRLGERDHAAVGEEEDEARGGDAEEEGLRHDRADPVVAEDGRADDEDDQHDDADRALDEHLGLARRHPALPKRPWGRNASTSASRTNVSTIEYCEQHAAPVTGRYAAEKVRVSAYRSEPAAAPSSEPMPPTMTTTSEFKSHCASWPERDVALRGADRGPEGGERGADDEGDREGLLDIEPERRGHLAVVDAGPDDHPRLRPVQPEPEDDPDEDAEREHHEAGERVLDLPDLQVDQAFRPARPRDADGVAAARLQHALAGEVCDHLVGDDHRDGDREQRLPQILALVPAEERLLDDEADDRDDCHRHEHGEDPLPRVDVRAGDGEPADAGHLLLHLVRDVAREEVERAVGHVHDPHQAEDEREAARNDEEQPGEGDGVEEDQEERARVVGGRAERGRLPVADARVGQRLRDHEDVEDGEEHDRRGDQLRQETAHVTETELLAHPRANVPRW